MGTIIEKFDVVFSRIDNKHRIFEASLKVFQLDDGFKSRINYSYDEQRSPEQMVWIKSGVEEFSHPDKDESVNNAKSWLQERIGDFQLHRQRS